MKPCLILFDRTTSKQFKKKFVTEFKRDCFARKLRYSNKLQVVYEAFVL